MIEDHSSQRFRLWYCLLDHQDVVCRRALLIIAAVLTATSACPAVLMQMLMISPSSLTKQEKRVHSALVSARTLLGNRFLLHNKRTTDDKAILHCLTDSTWNKTVTNFEDGTQSGVESGSNWIQLSPQDIGLNNLVGPGLYLMEGGTFEWRVDENGIWTVVSAMGSFSTLCETTVSGSPSLSPPIPSSSTRLMVVSGMTGSLALFVNAFIL